MTLQVFTQCIGVRWRYVLGLATLTASCRGKPLQEEAISMAMPEARGTAALVDAGSASLQTMQDARPDDSTASGAALAPLPGFFEALAVPGYPDAWLSLPTGATGKRPLAIVIHGAGDRPDWQCGGWRRATAEYAFVLCLRGKVDVASSTKTDVRYTHPGGAPLREHIDLAVKALVARYPDYVDPETPLLAGFSLGAYEILALAIDSPGRFPRIALVEGGGTAWNDARIARYLAGGGKRVLFGCGQEGGRRTANAAAQHLVRNGLDARVVFAPVGHTFDPPLEDAVRSELRWFVEGDERWSTVP